MAKSYNCCHRNMVDCVWNVMAHAQKPDIVFRRNGWFHLNRRGRQFSRLMAAEDCASAVVMLDTPCSEVVWSVLATYSTSFPFTSPPVRHRVPSHFSWYLLGLPSCKSLPRFCYRKLRCPRNILHLHLFMSFIMRALLTLLRDILFVKGVGLAKDVELDEGGLVEFKPDRNVSS